jgi:P-type Ca2+ transporter type 2C
VVNDREADPPTGATRVGMADDWHVLGTDEVLRLLEADEGGLTTHRAEETLSRVGPNVLEVKEPDPWWRVLARQFVSPLIGILVIAFAVTLVLREWVDAGAILVVLVINAGIGFWQERKAESAVRALKQLSAPTCRALRDGVEASLPAADVVPGDVVLLESGERVPADLRLLVVNGLRVDESMLTGEVMPVHKGHQALPDDTPPTDRTNICFSGTLVTSGRGRGVVVATGASTELGLINELVQGPSGLSPLQVLTHSLERRIGVVVAAVSTFVFVAGIALGHHPSEMFRTAVALAVASVPESLPIVLTVAMSLGVARMAKAHAIVRSLPAVETLGSTTVIGSDKTGTLTLNEMTVERVWTAEGFEDLPLARAPRGCLRDLMRAGALTNEAVADPDDPLSLTGDAVDVAMAHAALACEAVTPDERAATPECDAPYEPALRLSQTVRTDADGRRVLYVKGSPDVLAHHAEHLADDSGGRPVDHDLIEEANHALARRGLRVIATAYRTLGPDERLPEPMPTPSGLTFLGMEGMEDPPRPGVAEAVRRCQQAGITVTMITGDHPATASSIAGRLGLVGDSPPVTGQEMARMEDAELAERLAHTPVAARVSPQDKLRIVQLWQRKGEVVAVTGDGVNDAPALQAASIGVAMGRSGTDVAREAADIVLTDDNFVTIVHAVTQGRVTFSVICKATFFLLATGLAALLAVSVNVMAEGPLLLLPVQMLFINVVTTGIQGAALAFEPPEGDELSHPPRARSEGLLSGVLWARLALAGAWMAVALLAVFRWSLDQGYSEEHARTLVITLFIVMSFYLAGASRSERRLLLTMNPFGNGLLIVSSLAALLLYYGAMSWPVSADVLELVPLTATEWGACFLLGLSILVIVETDKLVRLRLRRRAHTVVDGR